jgi:SNF2 family DNA or RNA helicase
VRESIAPHPYQKEGIKFVIERGAAGLLLDPGLGKTRIILDAFRMLKAKRLVTRMLVIAPLRPCYSVWPKELAKWAELEGLTMAILHGPRKEEALLRRADIDVINPEGLPWLFRQDTLAKISDEGWPWSMLCVDESTRFKHTQTMRFKLLRPVLGNFKRRYILTGSPAPNGLLDLFGQIYILDLGYSLGRYISHYRSAYFQQGGYGGYEWRLRQGEEKNIHQKIKTLVLRMAAKDLLDLPPLIFNRVEVELPDKALRQYRQMEDQLILALEEEVVLSANASVAWGKCRQIANGGIYHEGGEAWTHLHEAKVDAVEEIVEELQGQPALIAYEYRHDLERLRSRLGSEVPFIGGGVSATRFREIESAWNAGELPVLLAQPQSVAHGLNLQGTGAAVVFAAQTPDLEVREQFIRRVWRQGQRERVVVHDVIAKDTVDEVIMQMIKHKDRTQQALLGALRAHLKRAA